MAFTDEEQRAAAKYPEHMFEAFEERAREDHMEWSEAASSLLDRLLEYNQRAKAAKLDDPNWEPPGPPDRIHLGTVSSLIEEQAQRFSGIANAVLAHRGDERLTDEQAADLEMLVKIWLLVASGSLRDQDTKDAETLRKRSEDAHRRVRFVRRVLEIAGPLDAQQVRALLTSEGFRELRGKATTSPWSEILNSDNGIDEFRGRLLVESRPERIVEFLLLPKRADILRKPWKRLLATARAGVDEDEAYRDIVDTFESTALKEPLGSNGPSDRDRIHTFEQATGVFQDLLSRTRRLRSEDTDMLVLDRSANNLFLAYRGCVQFEKRVVDTNRAPGRAPSHSEVWEWNPVGTAVANLNRHEVAVSPGWRYWYTWASTRNERADQLMSGVGTLITNHFGIAPLLFTTKAEFLTKLLAMIDSPRGDVLTRSRMQALNDEVTVVRGPSGALRQPISGYQVYDRGGGAAEELPDCPLIKIVFDLVVSHEELSAGTVQVLLQELDALWALHNVEVSSQQLVDEELLKILVRAEKGLVRTLREWYSERPKDDKSPAIARAILGHRRCPTIVAWTERAMLSRRVPRTAPQSAGAVTHKHAKGGT